MKKTVIMILFAIVIIALIGVLFFTDIISGKEDGLPKPTQASKEMIEEIQPKVKDTNMESQTENATSQKLSPFDIYPIPESADISVFETGDFVSYCEYQSKESIEEIKAYYKDMLLDTARIDGINENDDGMYMQGYYGQYYFWLDIIPPKDDTQFGNLTMLKLNYQPEEMSIIWQTVAGNLDEEYSNAVAKTDDGGYIVVGGSSGENSGGIQCFVLKFDAKGEYVWNKRLESHIQEHGVSVCQTNDGGYMLLTAEIHGKGDGCHLIKLSKDGETEWSKFYGETGYNGARMIAASSDKFVVCGTTGGTGSREAFVLNIDENGKQIWLKTYGDEIEIEAYSINNTFDGGYIVAGYSETQDGKDGWVLKLTHGGDPLWTRTFGGSREDFFSDVIQTQDGGFVLVGATRSADMENTDYMSEVESSLCAWMQVLYEDGSFMWALAIGGDRDDTFNSVVQRKDGLYIVLGETASSEIPGLNSREKERPDCRDIWVVKFTDERHLVWQKLYGSTEDEMAGKGLLEDDETYVFSAGSGLPNGDVEADNGHMDIWLVGLE